MKSEAKKYSITLGGEQYNVVSDEQEQDLLQAVTVVNDLLRSLSVPGKQRCMALVALQLASKNIALTEKINNTLMHEQDLLMLLEHGIATVL